MKFRQVTLRCFGPFKEQRLDFSGTDGLQIVFGPNEAGKSCSLKGILALLFGFPGQSTDNFRFQYSQFRVHAVLEGASGQTLECVRRKGNKDTLRRADDKAVCPERELGELLGGLDQTRFEQLFGLDAQRLVKGGQDIARGKGELGELVFAAGKGMSGLRDLALRLEEQQDALCTSTVRKGRIPESKVRHAEQMERCRELALPPETYADAVAKAESAEKRVTDLRRLRIEVRGRVGQVTRWRDALPTIERLAKARADLVPLEHAPILADDFAEQYRTAIQDRTLAIQALLDARNELTGLGRQLAETNPPASLLAVEEDVGQLKGLFGADLKQREERQQAETFRIKDVGLARDIFRDLTGSKDWDKMDEWKLRQEERNLITSLANRHAAVFQAVQREEKAVRICQAKCDGVQNELSTSEAVPDAGAWKAAIDPIVKMGPLEEGVRLKKDDILKVERQLAQDFARMQPALPGPWQNAATLRVPASEAVGQYAGELSTAERALQDVRQDLEETEKEITKQKRDLRKAEGPEPVPSVDDLTVARKDRDGGLVLVRRRLSGRPEDRPEGEFIARHTPGRELMDAAEFSVRQCDTLADRLRQEADRVAQAEAIRLQLQGLAEQRTTLTHEVERAAEALADVQARWEAIWTESKVRPQPPDVMRAWLTRWQKWCERKDGWDAAQIEIDAETKRITDLHQQVMAAGSLDATADTLAKALDRVQREIEQAAKLEAARTKLEDDRQRATADLVEAKANLRQAEADRDRWLTDWKNAVAVLRLREEFPAVQTAQDYVLGQDQMHDHLKQSRFKAARVREIDGDRASFLARLNDIRRRIEPGCRPTTADSLDLDFRALEGELGTATEARTRHRQLTERHRDATTKEQDATSRLRSAEAKLDALAAEAGVAAVDALPTAIQHARERAAATRDVRQFEDLLAQNTQGDSIEDFCRAAQAEREGLADRLSDLQEQAGRLDDDVSRAEAAWNDARRELDEHHQASATAAEARQQAALEASRLRDLVAEFAALHVARTALEHAKERYRAQHQDTVLNRAGGYFRALTDGAFVGLDIDNEDGVDVLTAVRKDSARPDARVRVDGLSDGTRDQLFLALRLAGIENHLTDREPIPLIVDDVLINFDDRRTKATLACLAEIARRTQVLVFTHHQHVVDLARAVHPNVAVHELMPESSELPTPAHAP